MATVETRHLSKRFKKGESAAVDDVSLATSEGEFLVLLGPSGSGKTTLLRMIAGLEEPSAGDVLIGGKVVTQLPPRQRRVAMVFQSYALYPHLSVYENIAFPLRAQGVVKDARRPKAEWAAELLGIGHLLERKPRELSGGERQRVALARAIVREPSVFLLDEPLSNLDAKLRASAREELSQLHRKAATTTIYVTHDQVEAMAMGDRVAVLHEGVVRQIGTPREVYDEPADTFVATFLGSPPMNLIESGGAIVGVRPEHLLPAESVADPAVRLCLRVGRVEYLGAERILQGTLEGAPWSGAKVAARIPATMQQQFSAGSSMDFAVAKASLKLFDRHTERRVAGGTFPWH